MSSHVRDVSERYIAKSNPWIVMVSTPNKPGGLFEQIELETEELYAWREPDIHTKRFRESKKIAKF